MKPLAVFVVLMFVIPLLELFDRWKARRTEEIGYDGAFSRERLFGWHACKSGECQVEVFHLCLPFVRHWRRSTKLVNFACGMVEGWHWPMVVHVIARGRDQAGIDHNDNRWWVEWIPKQDCRPVSLQEQFEDARR